MTADEYEATNQLCKSLALLACEAPLLQFLRRHALLKDVHCAWSSGNDVIMMSAAENQQPIEEQYQELAKESNIEAKFDSDEVLPEECLTEPDGSKAWLTDVIESSAQCDQGTFAFFAIYLISS